MALRRLSNSSIQTNGKSSKLWDQTTFQSGMFAIATVSLNSTAATVAFTSIPSTYTHLQLRVFAQDNRGTNADSINFAINSDTTQANYRTHRFIGYAGGALSQDFGNSYGTGSISGGNSASVFGASIFDILDYASTTKNKTIRALTGVENNGAGETGLYSTLWMNSSTAISSITLTPSNGTTFSANSHFALYGIKVA